MRAPERAPEVNSVSLDQVVPGDFVGDNDGRLHRIAHVYNDSSNQQGPQRLVKATEGRDLDVSDVNCCYRKEAVDISKWIKNSDLPALAASGEVLLDSKYCPLETLQKAMRRYLKPVN